MPVNYTVYDPETGRIRQTGSCEMADFDAQACYPGEAVLRGKYRDDKYYVVDGKPARRPALFRKTEYERAPGQVLRCDGIPAGTIIHVNHAGYVVEDGVFEFVSDLPGVFWVLVSGAFPLQEQSIKVTVK